MTVIAWLTEGTWQACINAAREFVPPDRELALLHVTPDEITDVAHGAFTGLLGRGHPERDPGARLAALAANAADEMLDTAAKRLGRNAARIERHGRVEHEVVRAADGAELLIIARDGDDHRLGPRSLGPATRFVVDHAPCAILLVWPEHAPGIDLLPPPPLPHHRR